MSKEGVVKRKFIPQNIIEELNSKYPAQCEDNGVAYRTDLKFITFDPYGDITARILAFDAEIGLGVLNVIFYFAAEMIKDGYRTKYDEYEYKYHIDACSSKYHIPADKVHQIVQFLISCNYFFVITDNEGVYLTTCQAVYDYERCMHTRMENRKRKQRSREKRKQLEQHNNTVTPPTITTSLTPLSLPEHTAEMYCNQEYGYPDTCNQIYSFPDTYETYKQDCEISAACIDDFSEPDEIERMIQDEMAWREQQGITSECDEYEAPDPVGDLILEEKDWLMQHGLNCDDAIPDDDFDYPIPYSDVIAI